ncbi:DUF1990 family protein [Cellulomonas sp. McL0617]|uniref:DUF1990 family protein n=1 Tax=Cellulomonas sp. McL0617 TaxID=3415675 RepID=UPI003CF002C1
MSVTYPEVGATATELPAGYHHLRASTTVGTGRELFEQRAETVLTWGIQRGAGLEVVPGHRVRVGEDHRIGIRLGPVRVWAPCRIVYVVDEPDRKGFAYGTLPGHPECGEESFIVALREDGTVEFELVAFSRPASRLARIGGPVTAAIQRRTTVRYLHAAHP